MAISEYDKANFNGVYEGKSLIESAKIVAVPWEIGMAQPIVSLLLSKAQLGRLLDVGCGLGRNAKAAYDLGFEVVAIDISEAAIVQCRAAYQDTSITFSVSSAYDTGFSTTFDVILDSATYHAIPSGDRVAYLTEMSRLASETTEFHLIAFAPSCQGMPKPLACELSEIAINAEQSGWMIQSVTRELYKGNAEAIKAFQEKKGLDIRLDEEGKTNLPVWHCVLRKQL